MAELPQALPPLSRADSAEVARRRRARNLVLLFVLLAVCGLFYAIALVKMARP